MRYEVEVAWCASGREQATILGIGMDEGPYVHTKHSDIGLSYCLLRCSDFCHRRRLLDSTFAPTAPNKIYRLLVDASLAS
jgi:hypothetical protein